MLAGCLDLGMAIKAAEKSLVAHHKGTILFPDKVVQTFDDDTLQRINCQPTTFLEEKIAGLKWVSVFPANPVLHGLPTLSAVIILSELEHGFPIAFMDGTLCSNMRVGAMGALAAKYLARPDSKSIGLIGCGEQAKMHLIAMKTGLPSLIECRIGARTRAEETRFIREMSPILTDMQFVAAGTKLQQATEGADIIVTATSAQRPLLKAEWMQKGAFYSHIGGWEDEYAVAAQCEKIVCDDWEVVKGRDQTLSRMFKDGELSENDIHGNLADLVNGDKPGRESEDERIYFNAAGLAYVDVAIALAMYQRAVETHAGMDLTIQESMIFEHHQLKDWIRL